MNLSRNFLIEKGSFVGAPVKKEITWKQNDETFAADVYVRKMSFHSAVNEIQAFTKNNNAIAGRIAGCICDEKGQALFTVDEITGSGVYQEQGPLNGSLTLALLNAIGEVNKLGEAEPES